MADSRAVTRDDILDLRKHIDVQFSRLDKSMTDVTDKVEEAARINAVQEHKIDEIKRDQTNKASKERVQALENTVSSMKKGMWAIGLAAITMVMRTVWELMINGTPPT